MNRIFNWLVLMTFVYVGCTVKALGDDSMTSIYHLAIGTSGIDFENDDIVSASGTAIDGQVTIYINDNPVSIYTGDGRLMQINQWLKSGINSLDLIGSSTLPLYIKIGKVLNNGEVEKIVLKKKIIPKNKKIEAKNRFKTDIKYKLPIFNKGNSSLPENVKNSVRNHLEMYFGLYNSGKYKDFVHLLLEGRTIWQKNAYAMNDKQLSDIAKQTLKAYTDNKFEFNLDVNKIIIITGKSTVYIYSDFGKNGVPFLCKAKLNSNEIKIPPMKLARFSDKWVIWE